MKIIRCDERIYAKAFSFFGFNRIYVGTLFDALPPDEQAAAIAHESGHCAGHHTEWRILALPLWWSALFTRMCHRQEFAADAHAVRTGNGPALARFVSRFTSDGVRYPAVADRLRSIHARIKSPGTA